MEKNILEQIEIYIKDIIGILEKQYALLEQQGYGKQALRDLMQRQIRLPSGIIMPLEAVEYNILYDHYDVIIVKTLILLQKNIFSHRDCPFITFSLRTLLEIGINFINILFADEITQTDKKHVKLLSTLIDFVSADKPPFREYFIKLFDAEKTKLTEEEIQIFQDILTLMKSKNDIELREKVIQARRMLSGVKNSLNANIEPLLVLDKENVRSFYSWQSHMLHGNPLLIQGVFDTQAKEINKNTIYTISITTGLNAIKRLATYLNNSNITIEVQNKNKEIDTLWPAFVKFSLSK